MPQYNAQKVWQRVHAQPPSQPNDAAQVLALIPALRQCSGICQQLTRQANPDQLRLLSRNFSTQAAALRGIYDLMTGQMPPATPAKIQIQSREGALRSCYTCQLRAITQYTALCAQEEFSPAFTALLPLARENCLTILALLGG